MVISVGQLLYAVYVWLSICVIMLMNLPIGLYMCEVSCVNVRVWLQLSIALRRIEVLIFIYPKRKACRRVLGVSSAESCVSSIRTQFERLI